MPALRLDGTWFEHLYEELPPVIEAMRHGTGPALVEAMVVRLDPHSSSDDQRKYRGETELQAITDRDPILQTERYLLRNGGGAPRRSRSRTPGIRAIPALSSSLLAYRFLCGVGTLALFPRGSHVP
jgi:TPP-dependent pyruvate/acetoin dehydrogenase alpha subunit